MRGRRIGARQRTARWQLLLFAKESDDGEPQLPEAIRAELVAVMAELLLEAAGVRQGGRTGGDDESEDHT